MENAPNVFSGSRSIQQQSMAKRRGSQRHCQHPTLVSEMEGCSALGALGLNVWPVGGRWRACQCLPQSDLWNIVEHFHCQRLVARFTNIPFDLKCGMLRYALFHCCQGNFGATPFDLSGVVAAVCTAALSPGIRNAEKNRWRL